jgi:hypothetical protein
MFEELKQRALKITEALYRTTDLFSDAEPLKWSLRQGALDILTSISLLDSTGYEKAREVSKLEILIKNSFLKLELAESGTFISKMNFEVLRREYGALLDKIVTVRDSYQKLLDSISNTSETDESRRLSDRKHTVVGATVGKSISDMEAGKSDKHLEPTLSISGVIAGHSHRQKFLLTALKDRGQSSIGDLAQAMTSAGFGVSEKTVQRELNSLVTSGDVRQDGEKRWRKYFI